jgi:hypothetical protein
MSDMTTIEQLLRTKLLRHGFQDDGMGGLVPPFGAGGMKVSEIIERCKAEATAEAAAPVDEIAGHKATQVIVDEIASSPLVTSYDPGTGDTSVYHVAFAPHWHEQNPWKDRVLYVPLAELAECMLAFDKPIQTSNGIVTCDLQFILDHWRQHGDKLDAYVLTGKTFTAGVRFGPEGEHYISPGFTLPKLWKLVQKYGNQERRSA